MKMRLGKWPGREILAAWLLTVLMAGQIGTAQAGDALISRPEVMQFIDEMVVQHQFDRQQMLAMFGQVKLRPDIIETITRPAESKPWFQYRPIFLTDARIEQGVKFWNDHAADLAHASETYGVPEEIIVAILGVETRYGASAGKHRVIDALTTLAFDYPPRAAFFRSELAAYLLMTREEHMDPLGLKGSYAGAMGKPQFIASSYRHYAVDFDGDGVRDLLNSTADAIGSVANYFNRHNWQSGQPVVSPARVQGEAYRKILEKGPKPHSEAPALADYGITVENPAPGLPGALIELETQNGREYWFGYQNFYVITRYNRSPLYAMAVHQLSQAIREQRQAGPADAE